MFSFFGGGHGGSIGDGLNHGNAPISTATIPPLEILEAAYPVMFTQWALRPDSGGAGAGPRRPRRVYEIELLEKRPMSSCSASAAGFPPRAWPAAARGPQPLPYEQDDGWHEPPMASKMSGIQAERASGAAGNAGRRRLRPAARRDPEASPATCPGLC
jgi:N-methylhydantoinase B